MRVGAVTATRAWTPVQAPVGARYGRVEHTPLGPLRLGAVGLVLAEKRALAEIDAAAQLFPHEAREGVAQALRASVRRAVEAHRAGRITALDAAASLEMMRELGEALRDLAAGNVEVIEHEVFEDRVERWLVRAPDGDELVVIARPVSDDEGEARLSVRLQQDDGVDLPSRYRMAARIDLEQRSGAPAVDIQFGSSALDKRIHGLYRDARGLPILGPTGREIADHHFRAGLAAKLSDPGGFAAMVSGFIERVMAPLTAR
jgi:hypothetical protein